MSLDLGEKENMMLKILRKNSRTPISEIAKKLGISRITANRMMEALVRREIIKSFTIETGIENNKLMIVELENVEMLDPEIILDDFLLLDGTHIVVIPFSETFSLDQVPVRKIHICKERKRHNSGSISSGLKCDFCGKSIISDPVKLKNGSDLYYLCCSSCEENMRKRLKALDSR